jgi:hypothetical protein
MKPEIKFERRFLLKDLPAPLERRTEHLQFFDNFLTDTRLFLRRVRAPRARIWEWKIVQQYAAAEMSFAQFYAELDLNEREYEVLSVFEANELRYNRYFLPLTTGDAMFVDVFLNRELWNLVLGTARFKDEKSAREFLIPSFALREVTGDSIFQPANLVDATLADLLREITV